VTSITVAGPNAMNVGATSEMIATAVRSDGSTQVVTTTAAWHSSNPAVATVTATGQVTAVAAGTSVISAAFGGRTGQISVQSMAVDNIQRVALTVNSVVIVGTCDENSLFENNVDGEFFFQLELLRDGGTNTIWSAGRAPYARGTHSVGRVVTPFNRNVTRGEDFTLRFTAWEYDGLLGADPRLDGHFRSRTYTYQGGGWTPAARSLDLRADANCAVSLDFSITSLAQASVQQ
jgi:hypothetical protein